LNDAEGAIADYSKAIELKPDYSQAYNSRGISKAAQGDMDGAMSDYNRAIELNFNNAKAYSNRSLARTTKGDLSGALADCNKAIELSPTSFEPYINCGIIEYKLGDVKDSMIQFSKAIHLNPAAKDIIKAEGYSVARGGLGISDRSISGMTAIFFHNIRSISDETTETQPLAGLQGEGGFGSHKR
jgi:tetratricopeptide (TPR) repeat protein